MSAVVQCRLLCGLAASHSYQVRARSAWMPALVGERI
jgi:hypothetical protein